MIASRAYHSLFVHNMLIRPTEEELRFFGTPDFTIYNAGAFKANRCDCLTCAQLHRFLLHGIEKLLLLLRLFEMIFTHTSFQVHQLHDQ